MRRLRGFLVAATVACTAGGMVALAGPQTAGADDSGAFSAIASASSFRVQFGSPGRFAVDYYVDAASPVSQAVVNGLGVSSAFASAPYPGETVVAGPGTFAGVTGLPNPGNYPFFVSTSYPSTTDSSAGVAGYDLKAHSEETSSTATAATGGWAADNALLAGRATSTASRDDAGTVKAASESDSRAIAIGDVLRIANARATAEVVRAPGTEPARTAAFSATGVTIAGQAVGLSEKGFTVAGTDTPLPDSSPLRAALSERGIAVTYLNRIETADGVTSPGLMISQTGTPPDGGPATVFQVVIGQAVAYVTNSAVSGIPAPAPAASETTSTDPELTPAPEPTAPSTDTSAPVALTAGSEGVALSALPLASPSTAMAADGTQPWDTPSSSAAPDGTVAPPPAVAVPASVGHRLSGSVTGPYLILVVGALAATAVSTLLRRKAVQSA